METWSWQTSKKDDIRKARIDARLRKERKMRTNCAMGNLISKRKTAVNSVSKIEKKGSNRHGQNWQWKDFLNSIDTFRFK